MWVFYWRKNIKQKCNDPYASLTKNMKSIVNLIDWINEKKKWNDDFWLYWNKKLLSIFCRQKNAVIKNASIKP